MVNTLFLLNTQSYPTFLYNFQFVFVNFKICTGIYALMFTWMVIRSGVFLKVSRASFLIKKSELFTAKIDENPESPDNVSSRTFRFPSSGINSYHNSLLRFFSQFPWIFNLEGPFNGSDLWAACIILKSSTLKFVKNVY